MVDEAIEFIKKHKLNSASSISAALKGLLARIQRADLKLDEYE